MKAMHGVKAGTFWINDPLTDNEAGPFGGMRWSGVGRELGEEGLDAFREPKHVHLDYVMERKSYWYPYADRRQGAPYRLSSLQNSVNTSTYRSISASVCCTDRVHCSSSPGVMKMPRLSSQGYEAANRSGIVSRKSR